jgi:hypothetical protein
MMDSIKERIEGLPGFCGKCPEGCEMDWDAALARLALARELLLLWQRWDGMEDGVPSPHEATDALLKALEVPR